MSVEELSERVRRAIAHALRLNPLIGRVVSRLDIYVSADVEVANTDGVNIYINPQILMELTPRQLARLLVFEGAHVVMEHPTRAELYGFDKAAAAIASDVKSSEYTGIDGIGKYEVPTSKKVALWLSTTEEFIKSLSFEELAMLLSQRRSDLSGIKPIEKEGFKAPQNAQLIYEGRKKKGAVEMPEASADLVKRMVEETKEEIREAGIEPLGEERVATPRAVRIRKLLEKAIDEAVSREVRRTWSRYSRKWEDYPGKVLLGVERLVALMDTSGSIRDDDLRLFAGVLRDIAMDRNINDFIVIPWDVYAYEPVKIRSLADTEQIRVRGGGGTRIYQALQKAIQLRPNITVVLSDWEIDDLTSIDVINSFERLQRSSALIAITISRDPPAYLRKAIIIKITQ